MLHSFCDIGRADPARTSLAMCCLAWWPLALKFAGEAAEEGLHNVHVKQEKGKRTTNTDTDALLRHPHGGLALHICCALV